MRVSEQEKIFARHNVHAARPHTKNNGADAALLAFLLVFTGYVVYQSAVDAGMVGGVFGGGFTALCTAAMALATWPYIREVLRTGWGRSAIGWLLLAFMLLFGFRIWGGYNAHADPNLLESHIAYLFKWVVLFMIARLIDPTANSFKTWMEYGFLAAAAVVLSRTSEEGILAAQLARNTVEDFQLDYQGVGLALLCLVLFLAPTIQHRSKRHAMYAVAILALFVSGARSEMVGLLVAVVVIEVCKVRDRMPMVLCAAAVAVVFTSILPSIDLPDHRMFKLFKVSEDQSAIERVEQIEAAWQTVKDNPLTGAYASYVKGYEAHNILSAWVDLGILGLLLQILIVFAPMVVMVRRFRRCHTDTLYQLTLACLAVSAVLLLFAKSFTYMTVPLAVGLYCRWTFQERLRRWCNASKKSLVMLS